jgi:hypothetical protein
MKLSSTDEALCYDSKPRLRNTLHMQVLIFPPAYFVQERSTSLSEAESLQNQNKELRALFNQYLSSKIISELVVPLTVLI